jgi:hypothetical protein
MVGAWVGVSNSDQRDQCVVHNVYCYSAVVWTVVIGFSCRVKKVSTPTCRVCRDEVNSFVLSLFQPIKSQSKGKLFGRTNFRQVLQCRGSDVPASATKTFS